MTLTHPGFTDPVLQSQACFRAVLDAMARPGTVHTAATPSPPPPLHPATAAVLLTLIDLDTPLWLDPPAAAAADWIAFHCGAPLVPRQHAAFAVAIPGTSDLAGLPAGSDEAPEQGATLIMQVDALGTGRPFQLSGPGLAAPTVLRVDGLPPGFVPAWRANHARYPRGIDLILCSGRHLAAFPRTLTMAEA